MRAAVLINFGGPRSLNEVEPFLKDIFEDVLPRPLRPFASFFAQLRKKRSSAMYQSIGGSSPVVEWTLKQASAVEERLAGKDIRVYAGMKYGPPSIPDAISKAARDGAEHIALLPLFPYRSRYTDINVAPAFRPYNGSQPDGRSHMISVPGWHLHPLYTKVMVCIIKDALKKWPVSAPASTELIFSVHAVPVSSIKAGDTYLRQVHESVSAIMRYFTGYNHHIAFQSAAGPFGWTSPSIRTVLKSLPARTNRQHDTYVLIIPLGFACENIETLYEIDRLYLPYARERLHIRNIQRTSALNDEPQFIDLLAELVLESVSG